MIAGALGWVGTVGTFCAYLLLWRGRLSSTSMTYACMNALGGILGGCASVLYQAWPSVASNFVWAALGAQTILATLWARHRRRIKSIVLVASAPVLDEPDALELAS